MFADSRVLVCADGADLQLPPSGVGLLDDAAHNLSLLLGLLTGATQSAMFALGGLRQQGT